MPSGCLTSFTLSSLVRTILVPSRSRMVALYLYPVWCHKNQMVAAPKTKRMAMPPSHSIMVLRTFQSVARRVTLSTAFPAWSK